MAVEENKQVVRRIYDEMINQEDISVVDGIIAPDVVQHDPLQGTLSGREVFLQLIELFNRAFPGHRVQVHSVVAKDDYVTVRHTHSGTHNGLFAGIPPSGRDFAVDGVEVWRLSGGKIVEFWRHDDLGLLIQLGAVPAPTAAS